MPKFHERFSVDIGVDVARRRFVHRTRKLIFGELFDELRIDNERALRRNMQLYFGDSDNDWRFELTQCIGDDFYRNLQAIEVFFNCSNEAFRTKLEWQLASLFKLSEVDLGVGWHSGRFVPSGAKLLDDRLVNDPLDWLRKRELANVAEPFEKCLSHLLRSGRQPELLADVVTDAYEALEAAAKIATRRDVDLSANAESFVKAIGAPEQYKQILKEYIACANRFRHAASERRPKPAISYKVAESFVYLTGVFLRLAFAE